jgi:TonB-dependent receptor
MSKKIHYYLLTCCCLLFTSFTAFAQQGTLSGNVIDAETGEELIGATVLAQGTSTGTVTDISGNYQLQLDPGTYTIVFSYISYASQSVEGVKIVEGEVNRIDIALETDDVQLEEVVVQAEQINNNEVSLLKLQQKSLAVQDGISMGEIRRIGASNSAESMKSVTGASVEGGKYIVMRGLGDRYSLTQVNGIVLPSTDPYRNSASLDLIPSSMVENIVTTKTFTPDQPGNFTGGNVNVSTRSIPDQFYVSAKVSLGYNTQASLIDNLLTDPISGQYDWLGYDDGSRALPNFVADPVTREALRNNSLYIDARSRGEDPENAEARRLYQGSADAFADRPFAPVLTSSGINHRFQFAVGNYKTLFGKNFGYNVGFNYSRSFRHYPNRILNIWELPGSLQDDSLNINLNTNGVQSIDNPTLGGLVGLALQLNNRNELSFTYTYNNDVEKSAGDLAGIWPGAIAGGHRFESRNVTFVQRTLNNLQLRGKHSYGAKNSQIEWVLGYTASEQDEPDTRVFANDISGGVYSIDRAEYDRPFHFFRNLNDQQISGKIDWEIPLGEANTDRIKLGLFGNRKTRDFEEFRFQHENNGLRLRDFTSFREADGDFDAYFAPGNTGVLGQNPNGTFQLAPTFLNQTLPSNRYTGTEQVLAAYAMGVYQASPKLKFIGGLRVEKTDFEVESGSESDSTGVIDELDLLPSINAVYALNDNSNLRLAGSRTLARPNMRELAPFVSFDFIGGFLYRGNPNINRGTVWNADIRYELFPRAGELIAVSAFYKFFNDPIQQRLSPVASGGQISYVNVDQGQLYGIELELRKNLDFISPALQNFKFTTNFTYTQSRVDLTDEEFAAFSSVNPEIEDFRPFQAQSPYIVNANLTYYDPESEFEATLYTNVFGRRLVANGFGGSPDVYEINGSGNTPTPDLRLTLSKRVFENFSVGFRVENILDYQVERNVEFKDTYFVQEQFSPGRTFTLSIGYGVGN